MTLYLFRQRWVGGVFLSLILFTVFGCTVEYTVPMREVAYPAGQRIPLHVQVVISDALRNAKWKKSSMGDDYILRLGNALVLNTQRLAHSSFQQVEFVRAVGAVPDTFDSVLIPTVIDIKRNRPATILADQTTSVIFEWKLTSADGNTVWVDTVVGEGTGPWSRYGEDAGIVQIERLLDDLFIKSYEAVQASPEIRDLVKVQSEKR